MENLMSEQIEGGLQAERDLLDHFAGLAMQGIISANTEMRAIGGQYSNDEHHPYQVKYLAEEAYVIAYAMLKSRRDMT